MSTLPLLDVGIDLKQRGHVRELSTNICVIDNDEPYDAIEMCVVRCPLLQSSARTNVPIELCLYGREIASKLLL